MPNPLKIAQLKQFLIAASRQSFRAAALETHRSQAAITLAMQSLEQEVGGALFEEGHQATLTPLGSAVLPLMAELVATHDRVLSDIHQLAAGRRGTLALAVMPSLAEEWLPRMLRDFVVGHPGVKFRIADVSSPHVGPLVARGEADIGVTGLVGDDPGLDRIAVAQDTFGVVCPPDHWIAQRGKPLAWKAIAGETLIENTTFHALQGHGLGAWIDNPYMVIANRTSLIAAVRAGLGITVLPTLAQPAPEFGLAFVPLVSPRVMRVVGVVRRAGLSLSPAAAQMHALMLESLAAFAHAKGAEILDR